MKDKPSLNQLGLVRVWVRWRNVSEHKMLGKENQDFKKITKFKYIVKISIFLKNKGSDPI